MHTSCLYRMKKKEKKSNEELPDLKFTIIISIRRRSSFSIFFFSSAASVDPSAYTQSFLQKIIFATYSHIDPLSHSLILFCYVWQTNERTTMMMMLDEKTPFYCVECERRKNDRALGLMTMMMRLINCCFSLFFLHISREKQRTM